MLGQRVVTAVVLLALLVPALFAPQSWPFNLLTLLLIAAAVQAPARTAPRANDGTMPL
jgi:phosphatidate cytidylyltransferase